MIRFLHRLTYLAQRNMWLVATSVAVMGGVVLSVWEPSDSASSSICFFRRCTGMSCPGCGLTRATAALMKGDWSRAADYHPLAAFIILQLVVGWVAWTLIKWGKLRSPNRLWLNLALASTGVLLVGVWVVRISIGTLPLA